MQKTTVTVYKNRGEVIEKLIGKDDIVLDVGFWGQAVKVNDPNWIHRLLKKRAKELYGIDLDYDETRITDLEHYQKANAESFGFGRKFSVIFAAELIEHLSNPGLFLEQARNHLMPRGVLILTTPNAFSLFSIFSKFLRDEPPVNPDHTMYFNKTVLTKLLEKNGFSVREVGFIDAFPFHSGIKRFLVYTLSRVLSFFTPKFSETLVMVATSQFRF